MPNVRVSEKSAIPAVPTIFFTSFCAGIFVLSGLSFLSVLKKCIIKRTGIRQPASEIHCEIFSSVFLFAKEGLVMLQIREDRKINPHDKHESPGCL